MRRKQTVTGGRLIRFGITLALVLRFCMGGSGAAGAGESKGNVASPVKVEIIEKRTVRPYVSLIGTVEPFRKSTVASEIEGLVIAFPARRGQKVSRGEVLARIETKPLLLDLKQAEASLAEANENYKNALSELRRAEELFKEKTISSRSYDDALYSASAMKQRIHALESRIEAIKYDVARCRIRAPFSGFVVEEHTQVGQWLKEGSAVVTIVELDPLLISVPVPDRYIHFLKRGQEVSLEFDFLPGHRTRVGSVRDIIPQGNERARTFPVQISVTNKDFSILAGMSPKVRFPAGEPYEALLVHKDAVVTSGDSHHIFVVRDGKAIREEVTEGQAFGSLVAVEGHLSAGEMVVVEGNERLRPAQEVHATERKGG
ncbi:MAG: efflux RND transporter periplasmic adaptor subunit [Desulfobacteraceae bacterium]